MIDCREMRPLAAGYAAGRLAAPERAEAAAHLATCAACRERAAIEGALDDALARLPRLRAPAALRRALEERLAAAIPSPAASPPRRRARGLRGWGAALAGACAAAALIVTVARLPGVRGHATGGLVADVVSDHLRVVSSARPAAIESGGIHQVKPWFTGKLDFAPRVAFSGDDEFPLVGGNIGHLDDRKTAEFLFKHRLHSITLLVFMPDGLSWPAGPGKRLGRLDVDEEIARGFSVLLWRDQGLGYALVSDVNLRDLEQLATQINGG